MANSLNESSLWRSNLYDQSRLGGAVPPAPPNQSTASKVWQFLTPWDEAKGQNFWNWGMPGQGRPNYKTPGSQITNPLEALKAVADPNRWSFASPVVTGATIPLAGPAASGIKSLAPIAAEQGAKGAAASIARGGLSNIGGSARAVFNESGALARGGTNVVANRAAQAAAAVPAALETGLGKVGALVGGEAIAKNRLDIGVKDVLSNKGASTGIVDITSHSSDGSIHNITMSPVDNPPTMAEVNFFAEKNARELTTTELKQLWTTVGQAAKDRGYTGITFNTENEGHANLYRRLGLTEFTNGQVPKGSYYFNTTPDEIMAKASNLRAPYNKSLSLRGALQEQNLIPLEQARAELVGKAPLSPAQETLALPAGPQALEGKVIKNPKTPVTAVAQPVTMAQAILNNPAKFTKARMKMYKVLNGLVRENILTDAEMKQFRQNEHFLADVITKSPKDSEAAAAQYHQMMEQVDNTIMGRHNPAPIPEPMVTPAPEGTVDLSKSSKEPVPFKLASNEDIQKMFTDNKGRRFAIWARENASLKGPKGVFARLAEQAVRSVAGVAAFVKPEPGSPADKMLQSIAVRAYNLAQRQNVVSLMRPKLLKYGDTVKLFNMDTAGHVGADIVTPRVKGASTAIYDVLEHPEDYMWTNKVAKDYTDESRSIIKGIMNTAKDEGVAVPEDVMFHRVVIGKTGSISGKFEESELGSSIMKERYYPTMEAGIQKEVKYGINPNDSVDDVVGYYLRSIYEKRFRNEVAESVIRKGHGVQPKLGEFEATATSINPSHPVTNPAFSGPHGGVLIFPKDVMKVAQHELTDKGQKWLNSAREVSGLGRIITASLDFSAPFLQGLPLLGTNPKLWAKATWQHYSFAGDPTRLVSWMNNSEISATRSEFVQYGGSASVFEYYEALKPIQQSLASFGTKGATQAKIANVVGSGIRNTFGRAESAFTGFGEVARISLWSSLKRPNMTDVELRDLAGVINRMTGVMSTEALGVGLTQRQVEDAFLFFAPRYTRAGLTLFANALTPGTLSGKMARRSLAGLAAGGTAMYLGVSTALGQTPKLDPNQADFMTIDLGGHKIGIGGIQTAVVRLGADVIATTSHNPQDLVLPFKAGNLNRWDNPFVKFWYNRSAPLFGTIYGAAVENKTFFGTKLDSPQAWAQFIAEKTTPIALQSLAPSNGVNATIPSFGANVIGMREYVPKPADPATAAANQVWAQYPAQLKSVSDEIVALEKTDPAAARQLLYKYPLIVNIRKTVAQQQAKAKAQAKLASA